MKIIISGGGIAGLTAGLTAKLAGHNPIIIQQRDKIDKPSFGGGIGLWPPSQLVMERLGVLKQLEDEGMYMPSARYYNSKGQVLAQPSSSFGKKFPVLCLQRQQLSKTLFKQCNKNGVQFRTNCTLQQVNQLIDKVEVKTSTKQLIEGDILIGADGIRSKVRDIILRNRQIPLVNPHHCGYAYFRAVLNLNSDTDLQYFAHSFESWGQKKRFGFVPLKSPKIFWFVAIPIGEEKLQSKTGSHLCTEEQKKWIINQFESWLGPINIKKILQMTPSSTILRTDISKVKDVTSFPWHSKANRLVILGDAANATAPNLAQGAGLAIQSAWDFISMVDLHNFAGLQNYMKKRKHRAQTVQELADLVAQIGQLPQPFSYIRNKSMILPTKYLPKIEKRIFERVVSYSLGGNKSTLYWNPPNIPLLRNLQNPDCILRKALGNQFFNLPEITKQFRASMIGFGYGEVSVVSSPLRKLLGLPENMKNQPFGAYCETSYDKKGRMSQEWTRIFGQGKQKGKKYQTTHFITPNLSLKYGNMLTQSLGGILNFLKFGYNITVEKDIVKYSSRGVWFSDYYIPFSKIFFPTSKWQEKQTSNGWSFEGEIKLPSIFGSFNLMKYSGSFTPVVISNLVKPSNKRVVIAGGTGMIGSAVAKAFYLDGWTVQILSRINSKSQKIPFAKAHYWDPNLCHNKKQIQKISNILKNADIVINLSGENPGTSLWTENVKQKILKSRTNSIKLILAACQKIGKNQSPLILQSSAAGIYGNQNQRILEDYQEPSPQTTFRVQTCKQIQNYFKGLSLNSIVLRIGHVLSSSGGLFPHLQFASKMNVCQFGQGRKYVPWVHIQDVANSFLHIAKNQELFRGKTLNICSPNHLTYEQILLNLNEVRKRRSLFVLPENMLKLVLGEMSSVLLDSQRMNPTGLLKSGFQFKYRDIRKALTSKDCL